MAYTTNLISIVIPAKNRPEFTAEAIESVLSQSMPTNFKKEVIVVDNRSKPKLKHILGNKFKNVRFVNNNGFDSPGGSRNVGLKFSKGKYIAFLDNDDKWREEFIKRSLKYLRATKAPATVCLTHPYFFGQFKESKKIKILLLNAARTLSLVLFYLLNRGRLPRSAFYLAQISHMLIDRSTLKSLMFNEKALAAEDWEFNVNMTKVMSMSIVPRKLVDFRYEPKSNTTRKEVVEGKEKAYKNLTKLLPRTHRKGLFHFLFKIYVKLFLLK